MPLCARKKCVSNGVLLERQNKAIIIIISHAKAAGTSSRLRRSLRAACGLTGASILFYNSRTGLAILWA